MPTYLGIGFTLTSEELREISKKYTDKPLAEKHVTVKGLKRDFNLDNLILVHNYNQDTKAVFFYKVINKSLSCLLIENIPEITFPENFENLKNTINPESKIGLLVYPNGCE